MAKIKVLACDNCGARDGGENGKVLSSTIVCAPRKELCADCRAEILRAAKFTQEEITAMIAAHDVPRERKAKPEAAAGIINTGAPVKGKG